MYKMYKTQGKQQFFYFLSGSRYLVYIWFLGTISIAPSCLLRYLETYLSVYFFSIFVVLHMWYTTAHLHIVDSSTKLQEQNLCFLIGVFISSQMLSPLPWGIMAVLPFFFLVFTSHYTVKVFISL